MSAVVHIRCDGCGRMSAQQAGTIQDAREAAYKRGGFSTGTVKCADHMSADLVSRLTAERDEARAERDRAVEVARDEARRTKIALRERDAATARAEPLGRYATVRHVRRRQLSPHLSGFEEEEDP